DGADNGLSSVVGDEAWKTTWEGFVGTPENWASNPGEAYGALGINISTLLVPAGAGAAAKATSLGVKIESVAAKASAAAADAGVPVSLSVKLGQLLADGLVTVGGGLTKLDDALNAALKPFADALAKADTSVADFAAWVKSLPEFQGPDGQFAGAPNGFKPDAPSGGKPDPWTTTVTAPDRVPGSPGGLVDEHGGMRDPGGRGPDLDGDGKLDVRDPDGTGRPPLQDGGAAEMPGGSAGPGGFPESPKEFPRPEPLQTIEVPKGEGPGKNTPFAKRDDLEPNTLYHVEGRGDFYTDASGKVTYVEATYGGKGNLNADLNKPQGNITYVVHPNAGEVPDGVSAAHVFVTDDLGRTVLAHTDHLSLGEADRSPSVQGRVGGEGGDGYDGGHLFGKGYGGGGEYTNMAAMLEAINRGGGKSYFTLENEWRDLLKADPSTNIEVRITPEYSGDSKVPDKFFVDYRINDGDWEQKEYENER
ncbi:DNA/RNA non-specific endonuclease, partial [Pseudoclavibacter helvolus]|uniref:DNA/RNA non-specific endonuclease n=1 Tax=Pseudoclavibacter helvolus TaxID=255205 RepID=UPI000A50D6D6